MKTEKVYNIRDHRYGEYSIGNEPKTIKSGEYTLINRYNDYYVVLIDGLQTWYKDDEYKLYFRTIKEYRKEKLLKIQSNIE